MQIQTVGLTLISQKSKIFASFPQGKPLWRNFQQLDKLEFASFLGLCYNKAKDVTKWIIKIVICVPGAAA